MKTSEGNYRRKYKNGLTIRPPISVPTTQTKPENLYDADRICRLPFSNRKGIGISPEASDRRGSAGRARKRISNFPAWLREPARRPDKRSHRAAGVSERSSYLVIASVLPLKRRYLGEPQPDTHALQFRGLDRRSRPSSSSPRRQSGRSS